MIGPLINERQIEKALGFVEQAKREGVTVAGLSSAIFTSNLEKGEQYALQLDTGMTHINDQTVNDSPHIPFGGNKASGLGRFGNPWVVDEFTSMKWVSVQTQARSFAF